MLGQRRFGMMIRARASKDSAIFTMLLPATCPTEDRKELPMDEKYKELHNWIEAITAATASKVKIVLPAFILLGSLPTWRANNGAGCVTRREYRVRV